MIAEIDGGQPVFHVSGQPIDLASGEPARVVRNQLPALTDRQGWVRFARSLRGQFAIVAAESGSAVAVTDLAGTWPVFRLRGANGNIALATSLAELEKSSTRAIRRTALFQYVAFGCMDLNGETIFSDIDRAPSASVTFYPGRLDPGSAEESFSYADWGRFATGACDDADAAAAELERLIVSHVTAAMGCHGNSRPAILLSGGTDSGLLAALLRAVFPGALACLTQDFRFRKYSEFSRASENARALGLETRPVLLTRAAHFAAVRALNSPAQDQPCVTVQAFNLWCLLEAVKGRGDFIIGEHADSLFLGFGHFFHGLPVEDGEYLRATSAMTARDKLAWVTPKPGIDEPSSELLAALGCPKSEYLEWLAALMESKAARFLPFADRHLTLMQQLNGQIDGGLSWQRIMLPVMRSLPGARIVSPFFDSAIIELALSLAVSLKYRNGKTKFLLRHMLRKHIDREMAKAPAASSPVAIWRLLPSVAERNSISPSFRSYYDRVSRRNALSRGRAVNHQMKVAALGIWMQGRGL